MVRAAALLSVLMLAACAAPPLEVQPTTVPGYEGVQDGEFFIQPVDPGYLTPDVRRAVVPYAGDEAPGTIVVDPFVRKLYHVLPDGQAMRYSVAVGRAGLGFRGQAIVGDKRQWPNWTPTANMIRTFPEMYAEYAGGLPGGLSNPLGARALYLYRGGRDTYYRIHGTSENSSIGHATSAGCIRLFNQDAIHLYEQVGTGTKVMVRSRADSERIEGRWMEDASGRLVPYDPMLEPQAPLAPMPVPVAQSPQRSPQAIQAALAERPEDMSLTGQF